MTIAGYHLALRDLPIDAVEAVVTKLVQGYWREVQFLPNPPEFANMVRDEIKRAGLINAPKQLAAPVVHIPFADKRDGIRDRMRREGRHMLADSLSHVDVERRAKAKEFPAGSRYSALLAEVWSPAR